MKKSSSKKSSKKKAASPKKAAKKTPASRTAQKSASQRKAKKASKKKSTTNTAPGLPHYETRIGDCRIFVLGTAHVSQKSVEDVRNLYKTIRPGQVAIELCPSRFESLANPDRWKSLDLAKVIKEKKLWLLVSSLILSAFQKKIGEATGSRPGEEMAIAAKLAKAGGSDLVLADRDIRTTLARAWARIGYFRRLWLASYLLTSLIVSEDIEEEDIEKLKEQDVLEDMLAALPPRFAHIKEVIIDERDRYLAENIRRAASEPDSLEDNIRIPSERPLRNNAARKKQARRKKSLLAVVGAGHLPGIRRILENKERIELEKLNETPKKSNLGAILSAFAFLAVMAGFSWIGYLKGSEALADMAILWIVGRSLGAGLGTLVARAKPLTILVTVLVAPFAYFLGFLGFRLWMLTALMELRERKPRVEDFENITKDTETFAQFRHALYHNRVIHLIFLIFATGMGLTLGNLPFFLNYIHSIWELL